MPSIDQRVVEMKFNNGAFQQGVQSTLSALDKLKEKLGFSGAAKGLENVSKAAGNVNLGPMSKAAESVGRSFSAMQVAAVTAIATVVNKALTAGANIVKGLTIKPITGGLGEYEKKLSSIQTILANTQAAGTNLKQVSAALDDLNKYSDQTIYNFGEMAKNIGTFTAAGVGLETATTSIKGIANLAALSGSSSEQASTAMYQLSQAISAGRVSLMDWNSVVNAGMGGSVFQRSLAETAVAMGKLPESAIKLEGAMKNVKINGQSFRESISAEGGPSWLTSDVLTTALGNFTGDMKEADLVAQGFTKSQAAAIMAQAETAKRAATVVKTGSQLMGTLREAAESGWAQTWEIILGDFEEAPKLWTAINNVIGGFIGRTADARNEMLKVWKDNGGRQAIIQGLSNAFKAMGAVIKPIGQAFREIFPPMTGQRLAELSKQFRNFTAGLMISGDTAQQIKSTFEGLFSIFKIGLMISGGLVKAIFGLFTTVGEGAGGILSVTAVIGEMIRKVHDLLESTGIVRGFFTAIVSPLALLKPVLGLISDLAGAISSLVTGDMDGFNRRVTAAFGAFGEAVGAVSDRFNAFTSRISESLGDVSSMLTKLSWGALESGNTVLAALAAAAANAAKFLSDFFADARGAISRLVESFQSASASGQSFLSGFGGGAIASISLLIQGITEKFREFKQAMDFGDTFSKFGSGASSAASGGATQLSSAGEALAKAWESVTSALSSFGKGAGGVLSAIGGFFETIATKLSDFIKKLDMTDVVAILNAGFFILIYTTLRKFVSNLGDMVGSINGTFDQLTGTLKSMQSAVRANIIMQIAVAVGVLVAALFILAKIDAAALKTALVALAVVFGQVAAMLYILTKIEPASMIGAGVGMIALAAAIVILATAIKKLGEMDPDVLIQGGIALSAMMAGLAAMVLVMNKLVGIPAAAAGLLILSAALLALSVSLKVYAAIPWKTIEQGLIKMALTLAALGVAMQTMPKGMVAKSAGIAILAGSLLVLSVALKVIAGLEGAGKAMIIIAGGLLAMALAMQVANGAFVGAIGLAIVAASIMVMVLALKAFVGVLQTLAAIPMKTIEKSIDNLIKVVQGIAKATLVLALVIPFLAALAAIAVVAGAGLVMLGAGMSLFAGGLAILGTVGTAGVMAFLAALPAMVLQVGLAFKAVLVVIRESASKIAEVAGAIVVAFVREIAKRAPQIFAAGLDMLIGFLKAIDSRIYQITSLAVSIVTKFIQALKDNLPKIITTGVDFVLSFVEGLARAIRGEKERTGKAGTDLAMALVEGMISGLRSLASKLIVFAVRVFMDLVSAVKGFLGIASPSRVFMTMGVDIIMGMINGIGSMIGGLLGKARSAITGAISAARGVIGDVASVGRNIVTGIINGVGALMGSLGGKARSAITGAISAARGAIGDVASVGRSVVQGIINGVGALMGSLSGKARSAITGAISAARGAIGDVASVGRSVVQGMINGVGALAGNLSGKARSAITGAISSARGAIGDVASVGRSVVQGMINGVGALAGNLGGKARSAVSGAISAAGNAIGGASSIGHNIINGMVNGVRNAAGNLASAAANAARAALNAAKNALGIKSPSREFFKVGAFAGEGMVDGIDSFAGIVAQSSEAVGTGAVRAVRESLSNLSDVVGGDIDSTPVIRPVVDLSGVRQGAGSINNILGGQQVSIGASLSSAGAASNGLLANQEATTSSTSEGASGSGFSFTQINNSPKALSAAELYRQTNNQLSVAKGALTNA